MRQTEVALLQQVLEVQRFHPALVLFRQGYHEPEIALKHLVERPVCPPGWCAVGPEWGDSSPPAPGLRRSVAQDDLLFCGEKRIRPMLPRYQPTQSPDMVSALRREYQPLQPPMRLAAGAAHRVATKNRPHQRSVSFTSPSLPCQVS